MWKKLILGLFLIIILPGFVFGESSSSSSSSSISGSWAGIIPGGKIMKTFFSGHIKYVEFELKEANLEF
jgi:hypothetical protein